MMIVISGESTATADVLEFEHLHDVVSQVVDALQEKFPDIEWEGEVQE